MDLKSSNSRLIPGIGRIPFPAYRGNEPYIFVSYAHKNAEAVFAEINRWNKQGYFSYMYPDFVKNGKLNGCRKKVCYAS